MANLLTLNNVCKNYDNNEVLKNINLNVEKGEIISVLGPSGCGKSTLLNLIAGILPLNGGEILLGDKVISSKKIHVPPEKRNINMVFQDYALWPHMTVKENIQYGLKLRKINEKVIGKKTNDITRLLHINNLLNRYPNELSGGQQQRVSIARALITEPSILLLDEPLSNLDVQLRIEMRTEMSYLFHELNTTVFHVTHDPSEAFALADRLVLMNNGTIDQVDTPLNCYEKPKTELVSGLLGAGNLLEKTETYEVNKNYATLKIGDDLIKGIYFTEKLGKNPVFKFRPEQCQWNIKKSDNSFRAKVQMSTFEGQFYRIMATTKSDEVFHFLHEKNIENGEEGYVRIEPKHLYIYP